MEDLEEDLFNCCYVCNKELLPQEKGARRQRRQCRKCIQTASRKRMRDVPVKTLYSKFYSSQHKRPSLPKEMVNRETVQRVYDRFEHKCALTGETNPSLLCITSKTHSAPKLEEDLVLLSSREALRINHLSREDREKLFEKN